MIRLSISLTFITIGILFSCKPNKASIAKETIISENKYSPQLLKLIETGEINLKNNQ